MKIVKDYASQTSAAPFKIVNDDGSEVETLTVDEKRATLDFATFVETYWEHGNVVVVEESDLVPNPEP